MIERLMRAIWRDGVAVAAKKIFLQTIHTLNPATRHQKMDIARRAEEFDHRHGVDTAGIINQTSITTDSPNQLHAVYYRGSDSLYFHNAISSLNINHSDYTFIDFGSGKGKVLLLASAYPFKRIVGVEFAEELRKVAENNIKRSGKCNIETHCLDATEYAIPKGCILCYFFNPFDEVVMSKVIANIRNAYKSRKTDIIIVYYTPRCGYLFDREKWLKRSNQVGPVTIWLSNEVGHYSEQDK